MSYILLLFCSFIACYESETTKDSEKKEDKQQKEQIESQKSEKKDPSILNMINEWKHISWKYEDEELELSELNVRPWAALKDLDKASKKQVKNNWEVSLNKIFTPKKAFLSKQDRKLLKNIPIQKFGQLLPPSKRNKTTKKDVEFRKELKVMYLLCWEMKYKDFDKIQMETIPQIEDKKQSAQYLEECEFWVFEKQLSTIKDKEMLNYYRLDVPFSSDFWTTYLKKKSDGLYEFHFEEWIQENSIPVQEENPNEEKETNTDSNVRDNDSSNSGASSMQKEAEKKYDTPISKSSSMSRDELCHKNPSDENKIVFKRAEKWVKLLKLKDEIIIDSRNQHIRYLKNLSPESCSNAKMIVDTLYSVLGCNPFKRPEYQKNCK